MARIAFDCAFNEETRTLTLTGDVDEAAAFELRRHVAVHASDRRSMVIDLSRVESLPSAAVGVIAAARAQMRAQFLSLTLVSTPGSVAGQVLPRYGMSVLDA